MCGPIALQSVGVSPRKTDLIRLAAQLAHALHLCATPLRSVEGDDQRTGVGLIARGNMQHIGADYAIYAYGAIPPGLEIAYRSKGLANLWSCPGSCAQHLDAYRQEIATQAAFASKIVLNLMKYSFQS